METLQEYIEKYKEIYSSWSEDDIEKYATMMFNKMSTVKHGDNIIHLDYYDGLITFNEIEEIEEILKNGEIELSRFDKNGVPYNSIEDFSLQVALFISNPIVQNIILGVSASVVWDSIKASSLYIWRKIKSRHWEIENKQTKQKINFGLKIKLSKNKSVNLKLDGEFSEELIIKSLDKSIELIKEINASNTSLNSSFFIFNQDTKMWSEIDIIEEIRKKHAMQK